MTSMTTDNTLAFDPAIEPLIPVCKANKQATCLATRPPCPETVRNWAVRGVRGIKLEVVKIGGKTMTSESALRRFLGKLSARVA